VASLAIGFAFVVTALQIVGYRRRDNRFDLHAKRIQLWHVCIYNIGTVNAIGLVFALSGLYPEFWSQIFVHFFWTIIVEEFLFLLLATTLTFHYFFWEKMWGHKRLHILLGGLLTPLFFLQFYIINGMGAFMVTPGAAEGSITQWGGTAGILGWDAIAFYNPSFLMLTFHRMFANWAYGGFFVAGVCGVLLYLTRNDRMKDFYENGGRMCFYIAFAALLSLPVVGYFYAHAMMKDPHGHEAYVNLMWGRGDVVLGGVDWWWLKHVIVAGMLGIGLAYWRRMGRIKEDFTLPGAMVYGIGGFYVMFYVAMGMVMTWFFFWMMLLAGVVAALVGAHLLKVHKDSARGVFLVMGVLSLVTVLLGGYVREAARPRFVGVDGERKPVAETDPNRYPAYDEVYAAPERAAAPGPMTMRLEPPEYARKMIRPEPAEPLDLISRKCVQCHTLERVRRYGGRDWRVVVERMRAYGLKLNHEEVGKTVAYLESGQPL
jgi:cytochrome bd-type quinol oxidase subunit 1